MAGAGEFATLGLSRGSPEFRRLGIGYALVDLVAYALEAGRGQEANVAPVAGTRRLRGLANTIAPGQSEHCTHEALWAFNSGESGPLTWRQGIRLYDTGAMLDRSQSPVLHKAPGAVDAGLEEKRQRLAKVVAKCWKNAQKRGETLARYGRANLDDAIKGGRALNDVKHHTGMRHGDWGPWLRRQVPGLSHRRANDWMYIWRYSDWDEIRDVANISEAIRTIRRIRRAEKRQRDHDEPPPLPDGQYSLIVADPPWPLQADSLPYPTMSLPAIYDLPVADVAADDAVLWLWVVDAFLAEAFEVIKRWGFTYARRTLVWDKRASAPHPWLPGQHELCLIATRGSPIIHPAKATTVLSNKRGRHSEKPMEFFDLVEEMCPARRRLEMFARPGDDGHYAREGRWTPWGDEIPRPILLLPAAE